MHIKSVHEKLLRIGIYDAEWDPGGHGTTCYHALFQTLQCVYFFHEHGVKVSKEIDFKDFEVGAAVYGMHEFVANEYDNLSKYLSIYESIRV